MEYQTTIKNAFTLSGPGLHTGKFIHATVKPAKANEGIVLRRIDLSPAVDIPAVADRVVGTNHGTTVAVGDASVSTIEHMMSAFHGMHVDNAIVEVDGPEVPILDGSARLWVEQIKKSGMETLGEERRVFKLSEAVEWSEPESGIVLHAEPADRFEVECNIEFASNLIGSQSATLVGYSDYEEAISRCRTFVFLHEVEMLLSLNLIKGGDLDNALVFVDKPLGDEEKNRLAKLYGRDPESIQVRDGVLNTIEPYYPNEPARHKLLDFVGDIYLVGRPVVGKFTLKCPGHRANVNLAAKIRQIMLEQK
ncbi:MAG: UDP-3-O-acyl-N-acetylglucosamine deacetylase [Bacteroidales bacterium]|nr:UDP-3-O-acyl-N-acetylglucosamine deacetylase [Bacteroidales bacterium]